MPSLKERLTTRIAEVRDRRPVLDHTMSAVQHYGSVNGTGQAGAVTFFGFLSFFPILALGFFFIGLISSVSPDLRDSLRTEVENLLPGVIGGDEGEIPLATFEQYAGTVGVVGLVGVLYSGLGWLSGMRAALRVMFVKTHQEQPNFFVGKARDLATLALIGVTLVVSVALSAVVSGFSKRVITWLGFDAAGVLPEALLWVVAHGLAIVASTVLLLTMFKLLAQPHAPRSSLVRGALIGAIGFELLKALAGFLIGQTKGQPSFQAFGVALILVVWINYFSRLVMLAAAWAYTSSAAADQRARESLRAPAAALQQLDERATRDAHSP
ncbi:MAG: YihY/virulence factor BrkB family protein [Nocardioides sp.]